MMEARNGKRASPSPFTRALIFPDRLNLKGRKSRECPGGIRIHWLPLTHHHLRLEKRGKLKGDLDRPTDVQRSKGPCQQESREEAHSLKAKKFYPISMLKKCTLDALPLEGHPLLVTKPLTYNISHHGFGLASLAAGHTHT